MSSRDGDFAARSHAAEARFDADAMTGRPVQEATEFYQARGFVVLVEQEGGTHVFSMMAERVRLAVNADGIVIGAQLG